MSRTITQYSNTEADRHPVNNGSSRGADGKESRQYDDASYDEWLKQQVSNGYPDWFIRWAFPREQYDGTDEWKGFKNIASFMAVLFGLGAGSSLFSGGNLIKVGSLAGASQSVTDGSGSSFMNFLKGLGSNLGTGLGSIGSALTGFASQYGSSLLNYQNMEKLIDKQNAYNTPSAQMQRFADAGLNPNLVYGLGNNGNQPGSGSIAPVDFDTSQREARLARMQIDTQTKMAEADVAQKMSAVRLNDANAEEIQSKKTYQDLQNRVFISTWNADMFNKLAQYNKIINDIKNDNIRTSFEKDLAEARKALAEFQSQPEYMQKLGGVEDAMSFIDSLFQKLAEKLRFYSDPETRLYDSKDGGQIQVTGSTF